MYTETTFTQSVMQQINKQIRFISYIITIDKSFLISVISILLTYSLYSLILDSGFIFSLRILKIFFVDLKDNFQYTGLFKDALLEVFPFWKFAPIAILIYMLLVLFKQVRKESETFHSF